MKYLFLPWWARLLAAYKRNELDMVQMQEEPRKEFHPTEVVKAMRDYDFTVDRDVGHRMLRLVEFAQSIPGPDDPFPGHDLDQILFYRDWIAFFARAWRSIIRGCDIKSSKTIHLFLFTGYFAKTLELFGIGNDEPGKEEINALINQMGIILSTVGECVVCWKNTSQKCAGCDFFRYCSAECQRKDWSVHKKFCKKNNVERFFKDYVTTLPWPDIVDSTETRFAVVFPSGKTFGVDLSDLIYCNKFHYHHHDHGEGGDYNDHHHHGH